MKSYDQTLKLFQYYLRNELVITDAAKVKSSHIRLYIRYLRERGKYTVTTANERWSNNNPANVLTTKMKLLVQQLPIINEI